MAAGFLTRLPMPALRRDDVPTLAAGFWAFPLVGAVVGLIGAATALVAMWLGATAATASILALAAMVGITGCLHEDGLADLADGIGGGDTAARRLEIMRDSRIGTFGVLALVLALGLAGASLAAISEAASAAQLTAVLVVSAAIARSVLWIPLVALEPARADGTGRLLQRPTLPVLLVGATLPAAFGPIVLGATGLAAVVGATLAAAAVTLMAERYLGGATGDVYGATVVASFTTALVFAGAVLS